MPADRPAAAIRAGSTADLDALGPLRVEVHRHHAASMPELAPYVSDDETWQVRRALYVELLAKPDTALLVAEADGAPIGDGLAHVLPVGETWLEDTWRTGARVGEIESLAVLPAFRGAGIGGELLTRLEGALRRRRARRDRRRAARQQRRDPALRATRLPADVALLRRRGTSVVRGARSRHLESRRQGRRASSTPEPHSRSPPTSYLSRLDGRDGPAGDAG